LVRTAVVGRALLGEAVERATELAGNAVEVEEKTVRLDRSVLGKDRARSSEQGFAVDRVRRHVGRIRPAKVRKHYGETERKR